MCPAQSATLKNPGGHLGTLGCPFSGDLWSLKDTFPWKQTASPLYLKSLDAEHKRKDECLTQSGVFFEFLQFL